MKKRRDLERLIDEGRGRKSARGSLLLLLILSCLVFFGVWAHYTEIDDVTRSEGRIVPSGDVQKVQAAESGVVMRIFVNEGELVEAGAPLMELDGEVLASQFVQEQQRAYGLRARIERLEAEIDGAALDFDEELIRDAPGLVQTEAALYAARLARLRDDVSVLENRRRQRQQELLENRIAESTAAETLGIVSEQVKMIEPLVKRGLEPEISLLNLRRTEAEARGDAKRSAAILERLGSALEEIDGQIAARRSDFRASALDDLAKAASELATLQPLLPALENRAARALLRAPVRGVVNRILRTTIGGTAQRGEDLVEIIPLDDHHMVEAYVRPADIAFLYPGQPVKVKVTAYDFSRYGGLDGEIVRIGADAVTRSERNDEPVFIVGVATTGEITDQAGDPVDIIPGMTAEVDILAGRKTVLDYIIRPVVRVKERAFRDG